MNRLQIERLQQILRGMQPPLPGHRIERQDWAWFDRNLAINHRRHPDFAEARRLLREIRAAQRAHVWPVGEDSDSSS